jgi:hypothetical protein
MKKLIFALAALLTAAIGLQAENVFYKVGPFYKLSVRGDVDIVYRVNPDSTGMARYDDADFTEEPFNLSINKGKLNVRRPTDATGNRPVLYLWSDFLMEATNEGVGEMSINLGAAAPEFSATLIGNGKIMVDNLDVTIANAAVKTGNGSIVLSGRTPEAYFAMIGAGVIQADNLEADLVDCKVIGTGTIGCNPVESLTVHGIGTTKIYYKGNPTVKKSGGAKLFMMESEEPVEVENSEDSEESDETVVDE